MTRRGRGSLVVGLDLLAPGCARLIAGADPADPRGRIQVEEGRAGLVIAAPHGSSDTATGVLGRDLARLTGFGLVVATGYANLDGEGRRCNVNRPTESVPGAAARLEVETGAARRVYRAYRRHVAEAAQGPLRLYVELHGDGGAESAARLEVATVGVSREDAWRLKTLLELVRDSRVPLDGRVPRFEVWVESQDPIRHTASAAKQVGILARTPLALHVELPRAARTTYREIYATVLADFLVQSSVLLLPPPR